jgi:hypothetical protein
MGRRSGWVGSARDGQLSPRITCEGAAGDGAAFGRSRARFVRLPHEGTGTRKELRPPGVPYARAKRKFFSSSPLRFAGLTGDPQGRGLYSRIPNANTFGNAE